MNLLDLMVKVGVDDQASGQMESLSAGAIAKAQVMGQAFYDAAKTIGGAAIDMGKTIVSGAVEGYGAYEQLTGGMKKLYGDASDTVIKDAQKAYKEVGVSANKYMESVAGFSAALRNSVKGDSKEAARLSNVAMKDIADNANTFGKYTVDELTEVYQALAKGQYQTLDNLNLGYGGSEAGMQQLIDKANKLRAAQGENSKLTIDSYADIVKAIHTVQEEMNITGTTENEAMGTIEGSINSVKAAWENLLTSIGGGDPKMVQESVSGIVDGIFGTFNKKLGEREGGVINNVLPVIQNVGNAILETLPGVAESVAKTFLETLGQTLGVDTSWLDGLLATIDDAKARIGEAIEGISGFAEDFGGGFLQNLDLTGFGEALTNLGTILGDLWSWVDTNILANGELIGSILGTIATVVGDVLNVATQLFQILEPYIPAIAAFVGTFGVLLPMFTAVSGAITAITGAVTFFTTVVLPAIGMIQSIPGLIAVIMSVLGGPVTIIAAIVAAIVAFVATNEDAREAVLNAVHAVVDFFTSLPETFGNIWEEVKRQWGEMVSNASENFEALKTAASEKWEAIKSTIGDAMSNAWNAVKEAAANIKDGLEEKWNEAVEFVTGIPQRITDALGDLGSLLWDAGQSIINGLLKSMKDAAEGLFNWVGGVADSIAELKGPISYDGVVLAPNGEALMDGLAGGLQEGYVGKVVPLVESMADGISGALGDASDNFTSKAVQEVEGNTISSILGDPNGSGSLANDFTSSSASRTSSASYATATGGSKSSPSYVRDEAAISMLKSIYSKMGGSQGNMVMESNRSTRQLAKRLAPDMSIELGRL